MNALELLIADHKKVDALFEEAEAAGEGTDRKEIFAQIKMELQAHAHVEESIFYPALQEEGDQELVELTSEALQEHQQAKTFLGELSIATDDRFDALLIKLIEDVRHHVEEEEGEMFPMVEAQFDADTIENWGVQMQAEKERFELSSETMHN